MALMQSCSGAGWAYATHPYTAIVIPAAHAPHGFVILETDEKTEQNGFPALKRRNTSQSNAFFSRYDTLNACMFVLQI
jgi:hypothetical protein